MTFDPNVWRSLNICDGSCRQFFLPSAIGEGSLRRGPVRPKAELQQKQGCEKQPNGVGDPCKTLLVWSMDRAGKEVQRLRSGEGGRGRSGAALRVKLQGASVNCVGHEEPLGRFN